MRKTKHMKQESKKINKKKVIIILAIIIVVISISLFVWAKVHKEEEPEQNVAEQQEEIEPENEVTENIAETNETEENENIEIVDTSDMPDKMQGYTVLGKIVIDKIGVEKNILKASQENMKAALDVAVTKFWGTDINEPRKLLHNRT